MVAASDSTSIVNATTRATTVIDAPPMAARTVCASPGVSRRGTGTWLDRPGKWLSSTTPITAATSATPARSAVRPQ